LESKKEIKIEGKDADDEPNSNKPQVEIDVKDIDKIVFSKDNQSFIH